MAGFEAFNAQGYKVAGSDYPNLVFYGKGTLSLVAYNIFGAGFDGAQYIGWAALPDDGATLRFYRSPVPVVENRGALWGAASGNTVEYFAFGPARVAGSGGLEVYGSDQVLKFSTATQFLPLAGLFVDSTSPQMTAYTLQTPFNRAGRIYAATLANGHCHFQLVRPLGRPYNVSYESQRMACLDSTGVYKSQMVGSLYWTHPWEERRIDMYPNGASAQRMLVADVTGL